jgi:hypothetical protein
LPLPVVLGLSVVSLAWPSFLNRIRIKRRGRNSADAFFSLLGLDRKRGGRKLNGTIEIQSDSEWFA